MRKEETHSGMSMFALGILTHGTEDGWLRPVHETGHGWYLPDIVGTLSDVKALFGKPKLFFINACMYTYTQRMFLRPPQGVYDRIALMT